MFPYLIHLPILLLLSGALWYASRQEPLRQFFWPGIGLKWLAGILLGLLYLHYYPYQGDTFAYFKDAVVLSQWAGQDFNNLLTLLLRDTGIPAPVTAQLSTYGQGRAFFLVKVLSIFSWFTSGSYWLCSLYFSLFSFWSMWRLANVLATLFPSGRTAAGVAFLLFPSVVFWSSGILKESITMGCLCGSLSYLLAWQLGYRKFSISRPRDIWAALFIALSCVVTWWLKFYYIGLLLPAYISFAVMDMSWKKVLPKSQPWLAALSVVVLFVIILSLTPRLLPKLTVSGFLESVVANHRAFIRVSTPGNTVQLDQLQPTLQSFLRNLPAALFAGLYRPLPWEGHHLLQAWVGLENAGLLLLTVAAMLHSKRLRGRTVLLLVTATLLYILPLAALMAFSAPNFGTLARYKIGYLPFFVFLLLNGIRLGKSYQGG